MACSINGKAIAAFATFCTVLVYLAVGAAIFQAIEESHENEQRKSYEDEVKCSSVKFCKVLYLFRDTEHTPRRTILLKLYNKFLTKVSKTRTPLSYTSYLTELTKTSTTS